MNERFAAAVSEEVSIECHERALFVQKTTSFDASAVVQIHHISRVEYAPVVHKQTTCA
jgi:hypothetical protein